MHNQITRLGLFTTTFIATASLAFANDPIVNESITIEFDQGDGPLPYSEDGFSFAETEGEMLAQVAMEQLGLLSISLPNIIEMTSTSGLPFDVLTLDFSTSKLVPPATFTITSNLGDEIMLLSTGGMTQPLMVDFVGVTSVQFRAEGVFTSFIIDNINIEVTPPPQTLYTSNNAAVLPADMAGKVYTDTIPLPAVSSVNYIDVVINHTWMGDVEMSVFDPAGNEFILTLGDEPDGGGGGSSDDLEGLYTFVATGGDTYDPVNGDGTKNPVYPPGVYNAETWQPGPHCPGLWTLSIRDEFVQDGGEIFSWSIAADPIVANAGPADFNADCSVDQSDLGILLANFGNSLDDGLGTNVCGDTDCDGDVDQSDLGVLLADFGNTCKILVP